MPQTKAEEKFYSQQVDRQRSKISRLIDGKLAAVEFQLLKKIFFGGEK